MLSFVTVATEIAAAAAFSAGAYYFLRNDEEAAPQPELEEEKPQTVDKGIIGLSAAPLSDVTVPRGPPNLRRNPTPAPLPTVFDSVGVNINDYMETTSESLNSSPRVAEELAWAAASLSDLEDVGGVVLVDSAGDIVWADGPLIGESQMLGRVVGRVAGSQKMEVLTEASETLFPFLQGAEEVAVLPVGSEGAVMVLASTEPQFFGLVEERTAKAVASRLAPFVSVTSEV